MSILWFNWSLRFNVPRAVRALRGLATRYGLEFVSQRGIQDDQKLNRLQREMVRAKAVFVWGGHYPGQDVVRQLARIHRVPYFVLEHGWFPQRQYFSVDPAGIIGDSSLNASLDWVADDDVAALHRFREDYQAKYRRSARVEDFTVVPLQLQRDAAIRLYSPWSTMQEFVDHVSSMIDGRIVFKTHPFRPKLRVRTDHEVVRSGPIHDLFGRCRSVVGINSTSLLEAAMLGCPVTALGNCPLRTHGVTDRLLAAYLARQCRVDGRDLPELLARLGLSPPHDSPCGPSVHESTVESR